MMNDVKVAGFVRRNSGLKKTETHDDPVCNLVVLVKRSYRTRDGQVREEESYIDVTAFDDLAEMCAREAHEGTMVIAEGHLRTSRTEKNGQVMYRAGVIARKVHFVDRIIERGAEAPKFKSEGGSWWKR